MAECKTLELVLAAIKKGGWAGGVGEITGKNSWRKCDNSTEETE